MTLLACGLSAANMWAQEPATDEEGFYLLASAADVEAFAAKVNAGESTLKARLVADIDCVSTASSTDRDTASATCT